MNKFLRTASMPRLLAVIAGVVVAIGGGTAIAVAATSGGPVPKPKQLSVAIHDALNAKPIQGISADVSFTNGLIPSAEIQGSDPLLSGGSGHVWISSDGRLRLELYGDNGDPEVVVNHGSWWVYDPSLQTVYEGKLPANTGGSAHTKSSSEALPTIAQIQSYINRLMGHVNVSGAIPSDVGGQPAYTLTVSPKHDGGMLGQIQLAWDAARGVPLRFAVYARGNNSPVLELKATGVSYGTIDPGVFNIPVPSGAHVVNVATPAATPTSQLKAVAKGAKKQHAEVTGVKAVAGKVSFGLVAPSKLDGLPRQSVSLLDMGDSHGALVTYGQNLGGIAVIEQPATANSSQRLNLSSGSGDHANGLALPTVTINGATGQELDTTLGTIVRFTRGGVTYTVMGSVPPYAADAAARAL